MRQMSEKKETKSSYVIELNKRIVCCECFFFHFFIFVQRFWRLVISTEYVLHIAQRLYNTAATESNIYVSTLARCSWYCCCCCWLLFCIFCQWIHTIVRTRARHQTKRNTRGKCLGAFMNECQNTISCWSITCKWCELALCLFICFCLFRSLFLFFR